MPVNRTLAVAVAVMSTTLAVGCTADTSEADEEADEAASDEAAIVGGVRSGPSDDAVVHVYAGSPCSGVLVAPKVVLTALHCVTRGLATATTSCGTSAVPLGATLPATAVRVSVGSSIMQLRHYDVSEIVTGSSRRICNGDVAALVLEDAVTGVTPRTVRTSRLTVGERLTAIGWGVDGRGMLPDFRRRRSGILVRDVGGGTYSGQVGGLTRMVSFGSKELVTAESICDGDSGGPLIDSRGRVAAIVSRVQRGCIGTLAVHSDVSHWDDLVDLARSRQ
jgi:hypothetical protein